MTALELNGIGHAYSGRFVLDEVHLAVSPGEIVALAGPSGCGKSTLVHIAAGLIDPMRGQVKPGYTRHGMVFQEPRLLPWLTAVDNIAYPLRLAGMGRRERRKRANHTADVVSLQPEDYGKFPVELSGGMRQRTAIARALIMEPDFIFFDEPFTALDVALKRQMQDLVVAAAREMRFAGLFITHDLAEAVRVAHRIVVLNTASRDIAGERAIPGEPGTRSDEYVFRIVQQFLNHDPLFARIMDIDERGSA